MASDRTIVLDSWWERRLREMSRWQDSFSVRGAVEFRNGPDNCSFAIPQPADPVVPTTKQLRVRFKITSAPFAGIYYAKPFKEDVNNQNVDSSALIESDVGTLGATASIIACHLPEIVIAPAQPLLKVGGIYSGDIVATQGAKQVVHFDVMPVGATTGAVSLAGSGATANTTTWSRGVDGKPVTLAVATRVYLDTSAHKLYLFVRTFTYDACGILTSISAEARSDIDTTTSCP